jgi:hypothetical protein
MFGKEERGQQFFGRKWLMLKEGVVYKNNKLYQCYKIEKYRNLLIKIRCR